MLQHCRISVLVMTACCVLWWPTDPWLLGRLPGAVPLFSTFRGVAALLGALFFLVTRSSLLRRHALAVHTLLVGAAFVVAGAAMARLGGPDRPWLYFSYVFPFVTVSLPLPPVRRALLTVFYSAVTVAGCFAFVPAHLASPFAPMLLSFHVCVALASMGSGHSIFLVVRENFFQARALERAAAEIQGYSEHLEERVAEQTVTLRRLLARFETAREEERAYVSRELHDELGQHLTALRYALAFTRKRYLGEPEAIGDNLAEIDGLLVRTSTSVRTLVTALRPRVLDDLGLCAALEWLVRGTADRTGLACTFLVEGDDSALAGEQPIAVFRATQEALTNALRHAAPQRIDVLLRIERAGLDLRVRDDGSGFDPERDPVGMGRGMGLVGMRERAHALGGEMTIDSAPARGTTVRLRLPLTSDDRGAASDAVRG